METTKLRPPERETPIQNCLRWFPNKLSSRMTSGTDKNWFMEASIYDKYSIYTYIFKPVYPKGNQPWIFIERTDAEAEAPILWPPDPKSQCFGKDPDYWKDWRQKEKGTAENEMLEGITDSMDMSNLNKLQEIMKDREACHASFHGVTKNRSQRITKT